MNRIKLTTDYVYPKSISKELTLIHLSDIHFSIKTKKKELDRIVSFVAKTKPDYIMITGDIIDEPSITKNNKIKELITFLSNLTSIAKVLISLGNHDIILKDDIKFFNKLDDIKDIYILNNKNYTDEHINVLGLTLPNYYYYNCSRDESTEALLKYLDEEAKPLLKIKEGIPNVLLIHSPIKLSEQSIIEKLKNYDLILCGHTHAGMVPDILKFLFPQNSGIISPYKDFFPEIAKGKIVKESRDYKTTIIINGGITKLSNRSGINRLNFVYNKDINKIILQKKRGIIDE